jgi:hypothetical protein
MVDGGDQIAGVERWRLESRLSIRVGLARIFISLGKRGLVCQRVALGGNRGKTES